MTTRRSTTPTSVSDDPATGGWPAGDDDVASSGAATTAPGRAEPEHPLAEAGQGAVESAGRIAERATDIGFRQADRGREQAAEGVDQLADSMRRVSIDMQHDQPGIAGVAMSAADQASQVARYLRETDARQLVAAVENLARRQPLLFLGGAFVLGVAASRFLKAASGAGAPSHLTPSYSAHAGGAYRPTGPGIGGGHRG